MNHLSGAARAKGGYNFQNAARYWTYLTSIICKTKEPLDNDLPDNKYFLRYGPGYELSITKKQFDDLNSEHEMETTYQTIKGNIGWIFVTNFTQLMVCFTEFSFFFFLENLKKYNVFNC